MEIVNVDKIHDTNTNLKYSVSNKFQFSLHSDVFMRPINSGMCNGFFTSSCSKTKDCSNFDIDKI